MNDNILLTVEEMYEADAGAVAYGVSSLRLMEAAGSGVAREICRRWKPQPVAVLCGPGNNGGDGFVVARKLANRGWPVRVALLGSLEKLKGDAKHYADRWKGEIAPLDDGVLHGNPLVVDGLFGAGLERPVGGDAAQIIQSINDRDLPCIAIDIPSGVHGNTGEVLGVAAKCRLTVTFFRAKPGHRLLPGRELCGELAVIDIGIPSSVLSRIQPKIFENGPSLWLRRLRWPGAGSNKYDRGHAVVMGGDQMTGAARLAASSARRIGAGLVTIVAAASVFNVYASGSPGTIVAPMVEGDEFTSLIADKRKNAVLIGPGAGASDNTRQRVIAILSTGKKCVLDADALTVFGGDPDELFEAINSPCLLTPHEGEFGRLFDVKGDKIARACEAARRSNAVVLLKGSDTVIASNSGCTAINAGAPPELATAGSGDVLAGMALGLMAQGVDPFFAGCAAAWLHSQAAAAFGPGLIAEDLVDGIPAMLKRLRTEFKTFGED